MRSRKYNKRIAFYQTNITPNNDGFGGGGESYATPTLLATSWCEIKTASNNSKFVGRMTELGITDPTLAIIVQLRHRNDIDYNAIDMYLLYNGVKYIIQNAPTNINFEGVDVEIIATRESTIG